MEVFPPRKGARGNGDGEHEHDEFQSGISERVVTNIPYPLESRVRDGSLSPGRLFLIALLFVLAAPQYWKRVELQPNSAPAGYESIDLYQYVYPVYDYGFRRLREGSVPLWNPDQFCGTPYQADPQVGFFQPLNAVFLFLPTERALAVHAFLSLCLMGAGFALFARSLGTGYWAALLGALVYAFSGASAAAMSRPSLAAALAWAPLLLWAAGLAMRNHGAGGIVLAGLCTAGLILTGANALVVVFLLLLVAFGLLAALTAGSRVRHARAHRVAGLAAVFLLGAAVSAVQWGPTLAWLAGPGAPDAEFWNMREAAKVPATPFEFFLQFTAVGGQSLPRLMYFGIAPLLLAPAAFFHARLRRWALLFGGAAAVGFAAVLLEPALPEFPFPLRAFAYGALLSMAVLAALGADNFLSLRKGLPRRRYWSLSLTVLAFALVVFLLFPVRGYVMVTLAALLPVVLFRRAWSGVLSGAALALLVFVDLMSASVNAYPHPFQDAPECYHRYGAGLAAAQEAAQGNRTLVSAAPQNVRLPANLGMLSGLRVAGGYGLPQTKAQAAWARRLRPRPPETPDAPAPEPPYALLNFAAVRALALTTDGPIPPGAPGLELREFQSDGDLLVYVNEDALPRAHWVPACRIAEGTEAALDLLASPDFNRDKLCVIDAAAPGADPRAEGAPELTDDQLRLVGVTRADAPCSVEDVSPEQVRIRVDAPQAGLTVLADTFAPGWEATVDGVPHPILRANGMFRAVVTPAGAHEIVFRYRPREFRFASAVSLATLGLLAAFGLVRLSGAVTRGGGAS
jgi:hypothetical protein